ncbi:hypothetical protein [Mycolicibacterium sp. CBMA 226]|uniref:hypothetical protein n=1 Tax=Mycolicibacterium sp. CBMA 226 TaxID=2606611 RepID=UPI0012DDAA61|nr:hypothetical protein [Mycolicibacterium sp. CBMA 226]MUL78645.1 hypothetical protein [Mycolicibacterium sp. CBMA 226]
MAEHLATVPATDGNNYTVNEFGPTLYLIRRDTGRTRLVVAKADVYALTDALTDLLEQGG